MAKETEIVNYIDTAVKDNLLSKKLFIGAKAYGLCEVFNDGNTTNIYHTNESTPDVVVYNDVHSIETYHIVNGPSRFIQNDKKGFGNDAGFIESTPMMLVVVFNFVKVRKSAFQLKNALHAVIPASLPLTLKESLKLSDCRINLHSINANPAAKREHLSRLDPSVKVIEVNYEINTSYGRACIDSICCD